MLEKFPEIWNLIKGRVITDLNLLAVGFLIWMMAHENTASIPVVASLPVILQPIAKILFPVLWGVAIQLLVRLTREDAANTAKAQVIFDNLTQDVGAVIEHPSVKTVSEVLSRDLIPPVEHAIETAIPAAAPVLEKVIPEIEAIPAQIAAGQHVDLGGIEATVVTAAEPVIATAIMGTLSSVVSVAHHSDHPVA